MRESGPAFDPRLVRRLRLAARIAGGAVTGIGLLVLLGRTFDVAAFKSVLPGLLSMEATPAAGFVLAGTALSLLAGDAAGSARRRVSQLCAVGALAIGSFTIAEYATGRDLGIDLLLFHEPPGAAGTPLPGRMAPQSALAFALLGLALLGIDRETRSGWRPASGLALVAGFLSLLALVGYAYGAEELYGIARYTAMALPAALAFLLSSAGVLCARADRGPMTVLTRSGPGGGMARMLFPVAMLPFVLAWVRLWGQRAGYYDTAFGVAAIATATATLFAGFVWWAARRMLSEETARWQVESALGESEERFRRLAEHAPDIIYRYRPGPDAGVEYVSPALTATLGYTPGELCADPGLLPKLVHPDERALLDAVAGGRLPERESMTLRCVHKSGQAVWIETRGVTIRDSAGRPVAVEGIARDVTDRKRAEDQLRLQTSALEAAANAIMISDADGTIQWVNKALTALTGYERDELVGQNPRMLRSGRQERSFYESLWRTILGGGVWSGRMVNRRKDGSLYTEEATITPVFSDRQQITHFVAIKQDVTERLRREEALQASEARYRSLFERDLTGVYRAALDGRFLVCNEAFARIYGYDSAADLLQHSAWELHPSDEDWEKFLADLRRKGSLTNYEAQGRRKDGRPISILENVSLVDDDPSGSRTLEGTVIDQTERKRLEELLWQSQKFEAIGQLAGGVAHDFNNILAVITGHGELALRQLGPDHPSRGRVDQMLKAAEHAAGLTRQLLVFGRKQIMHPKALDLNVIMTNIEKMLGRLIGEDIDMVVHPAAGLGTVRADPGQIEQIILNLAGNARDAMPKGGRLTLETANVDLGEDYAALHPPVQVGRYVMLAVSDTGIGMDEETQRRVFEPFFTTKPEGQGTGMGLATVYGIVKQSGGYIWVYSEPGRGTTFKVYLPRIDESEQVARPGGPPGEAPRGQETILLVEDAEALREVIRETLEERGYTVLLASNGKEAIALAREHEGPVHLLLTDVVMPTLGGGELATRLLAQRPEIRVLYMSGYTNGTISQHGVLGQGVMLLEKPFTGGQLARAVREALDRPSPQG